MPEEAINNLLLAKNSDIFDRRSLEAAKRAACREFGLKKILNADILAGYRRLVAEGACPRSEKLEGLLRKRSIRTLSGIAPVAVLTEPYPCPGHCAYCPHQKDVPVSYLANEPAVMRGIRCHYDPYLQTYSRLEALERNGHHPNKIELIVIGGTWSYLPDKYQYWYIAECFRAANDYGRRPSAPLRKTASLENLKERLRTEQKKNETAAYKLVGVTLETRPDYLDDKELRQMRELGCTRVEIGVQMPDDGILKINKRGHGVAEIAAASAALKRFGFKVTYHIMPALPGSDPKKDLELFKLLFADERFQPDQIKFYPTVVTKGSLLYRWYRQGKYHPYSDAELQDLIIACKAVVPPYVRIIRLIRDIPSESIIAGNKITNLRQIMKDRGAKCSCIRCREAKEAPLEKHKVNVLEYRSSGGLELFISADSLDGARLYGFCRLRLDSESPIAPAIVRELHVYGELVPAGEEGEIQHRGLGKELLSRAEKLAAASGAARLAIISGVGVRDYYRHLGYRLSGTYMAKALFDKKRTPKLR